jgi:hypothetical protein
MTGHRSRTRQHFALTALLVVSACRDGLVLDCTSEGATWEISPAQVSAGIGQRVTITVTQISCSGRRRVPVFPMMTIADTNIASATNTERFVLGRAKGTTTLTLTGDNGVGPAEIPVVVP